MKKNLAIVSLLFVSMAWSILPWRKNPPYPTILIQARAILSCPTSMPTRRSCIPTRRSDTTSIPPRMVLLDGVDGNIMPSLPRNWVRR